MQNLSALTPLKPSFLSWNSSRSAEQVPMALHTLWQQCLQKTHKHYMGSLVYHCFFVLFMWTNSFIIMWVFLNHNGNNHPNLRKCMTRTVKHKPVLVTYTVKKQWKNSGLWDFLGEWQERVKLKDQTRLYIYKGNTTDKCINCLSHTDLKRNAGKEPERDKLIFKSQRQRYTKGWGWGVRMGGGNDRVRWTEWHKGRWGQRETNKQTKKIARDWYKMEVKQMHAPTLEVP